jgi:predicted acetyltransferase
MPELVRPASRFRRSYVVAASEFAAEGRGPEAKELDSDASFAALVEAIVREADGGLPRPSGRVPATTLWWVDDDEYLGRVAIRHRLTDALNKVGGHIGYEIRPSARRRGHATAMLRAALPVARSLGIDRALITCDVDNIASRRVIEANGGELENELDGKLRFWVPTS